MLAREVGRELAYTVVPYFADDPAGWRALGALAREAHRRLGEAGGEPVMCGNPTRPGSKPCSLVISSAL